MNNASQQLLCSDFAQIDLDEVAKIFRTNILQMLAVTKFALPHLHKGDSYVVLLSLIWSFELKGPCRIINNTSVTTFRGSKSMVDYSATKGAIVGFTRSLAVQLVPKGIRVNAVA